MSFLVTVSRSALNIGAFEATQLVSHLPAIRDTGRSFGQNELSSQKVVSQSYHLSLSKPSFQVELYVAMQLAEFKTYKSRSSLSRISISFNQTWKLRAWKLKFPLSVSFYCFDRSGLWISDSCEIYVLRHLWHLFVAENCESSFPSPDAFKNMPPV